MLAPWKNSYEKARQSIKEQRHHFADKGPYSQSYGFSSSHIWMWNVLLYRRLSTKELILFEKLFWRRLLRVSWTARRSNQSILKEINPEYLRKDWCWTWNSSTLATWCKELTHWKRPRCWERSRARREGCDRGWDGWMASLTQWTSVWASLGRWWRTEKLSMLQFMDCKESDMTEWLNNNNKCLE